MSDTASLKPCLVLGTGFHHWVLGDATDYGSLVSWESLLRKTAFNMQIPWPSTHGNRLALQWETLTLFAAHNGYLNTRYNKWVSPPNAQQVFRIEAEMKREAGVILKDLQKRYPWESSRASFPKSGFWGAVVSLNFDMAWFSNEDVHWSKLHGSVCTRSVETSPDRERLRLNNACNLTSETKDDLRVWFPNGCTAHHESLRLGLRDFGMQVSAIKNAFEQVKSFERAYRATPKADWANYFEALRPIMDGYPTLHSHFGNNPLPLSWVTEMLYRPVLFAGVGLSQDELGLWWLMCQRARNLAHIPESQRPKTAILIRRDNPELAFWQSKPFGIEPLVCASWDEGWSQCELWSNTYE